jgi:hypothetical protein
VHGPQLVLEDVRNEFLSRKQADEAYGVVVNPAFELDRDATKRRQELSTRQG